ncbi:MULTISPECIES: hypothetical protein [unclassified Acinetobacter]|uniref:hypothetical protein n=1 Tax=unclassified Acinetobacter TaxID=196816 RepID=UPI001F4AA392|nr:MULTISPECIES: hypothetical protein [unclassified Acinetobacter]MCH7353293.1 hypothetical protein [Acinetobacter sp. NIPH 2023]MCH7360675.1 hypothetical protein [Acinetobacter sp. NIPH 2024]
MFKVGKCGCAKTRTYNDGICDQCGLNECESQGSSLGIIEMLGGIDLAKSRLKAAKQNGSLLLSVSTERGMASIYDFKVEQAIQEWEQNNE